MCGILFIHEGKTSSDSFARGLKSIYHRGPDDVEVLNLPSAKLGFTRLAIMDLSHAGDQPFSNNKKHYMCNGEIYNFQELENKYKFDYKSTSDCEVLIPMFEQEGLVKMLPLLDGEFALVVYDEEADEVFAARDPIGIRPLFYGKTSENKICFASEVKALQELCDDIKPFPPGSYYLNGKIEKYIDLCEVNEFNGHEINEVCLNINKYLSKGVIKRLNSDASIGFLLSGGLDSSLVCSIAQKHSDKPIKTFAIGMESDAIDLKYAKEVAEYIGSDHTEVIINKDDVLVCIEDVIKHLESFDITTVRASIGMYLVCKFIHEKTDIKVLLTGEVSDEIFGYKYTDFAPSAQEFQNEAAKRLRELYVYDVLRADRCIAAHSLEARVPFSDTDFVRYVMGIDPKIKMNSYGHGKFLLRKAFEDGDYLPHDILYREKAAFSDAVGHSLVDFIKEYAEFKYTDRKYKEKVLLYDEVQPFTKESLLFREIFEKHYHGLSGLIPSFWMPNKSWDNCDVSDPSARVLPNYGASGE